MVAMTSYRYDVFLNFHGEEVGRRFCSHLYSALSQRGVLTFMDDVSLSKGEEISSSILNAIKKSRMTIVIFSENYASSTWCLKELALIMEIMDTKQNMYVLPVFYGVDPSQVRHQKGTYAEAFAEHEKGRFNYDKEKVQKWRFALCQAADLPGLHFKHGEESYEYDFITNITEHICSKLNRPLLHVANYPVGLGSRISDVLSLVSSEFDNKVHMLGIVGMGGLGKSTIASIVYNLIAYQFEGSCFLANIREKSTGHGLVQIQETMLSELVGERNIKLGDVYQGMSILKERLHQKKILLILDDVDKIEQLQATAGGLDWFGSGSTIIVTTRDKHLLHVHGIENLHEVKILNDGEALELFMWNAFKSKKVDPSYMEITNHWIHYAGGLPLALETIGSNLFGKTLAEWKSTLDAYERIPNRDVYKILRVSYDGLKENEKDIFLDIACFFTGCPVRYVTNMSHACGFHAKYGMTMLEKKSLINICRSVEYDGDIVKMHDLIQCMGKEIVRQQSTWPQKRSRLWLYEDIIWVSEKNKENDKVEAITLDMPEYKEVQWNQDVLGKMKNLRMLIKRNRCCFRSPKHLPNGLRVLEWQGYPAASLPSNFQLKNLVILNFSYSSFQWDKPLEKSNVLSHLIFTGCEYIRQIPDVSGFPNLTELCVDDCLNLIEIHDSVGFLDNLQRLSAKGCAKLRILPRGVKLTSLDYLCLRGCSSLVIFPEILGPMEKLEFVDLEGTALENLPLSGQNLEGLHRLHLNRCKMLENNVLSNIIQMMPNFFPFLQILNLQYSNLTILPSCIEECHFLERLDLSYSKLLQEIKGVPTNTKDLVLYDCTSLKTDCSTLNMLLSQAICSSTSKFYVLPGQEIPGWFDFTSRGNSLHFWFRKEFPSIMVCSVLGVWDNIKDPLPMHFSVKINDVEIPLFYNKHNLGTDHIFMFNYTKNSRDLQRGRLLLEEEWNHGEVLFVTPPDSGCSGSIKCIGLYVNPIFSRMEDVRFNHPYLPKHICDDSCSNNHDTDNLLMLPCEAPDEQELQQQHLALFNSTIPVGSEIGKCKKEYLLKCPYWKQPLNYVYNNSDSVESVCTIDGSSSDPDVAFLDHQAKVLKESSLVPGPVVIQNIRAQSPTSSSDQVRQGLHQGTSSTVLPTTVEASLGSQTELAEDDVEMEAFYASLDANTLAVSHSNDKSTTTALREEAREALGIVQEFITNNASVLLHPEQCSVMKTSLEYLSSLSGDDGISTEMRALISETAREFTRFSRDFIEASIKIESTASELQRGEELEAGLETNMNQFQEVVALECEFLEKLAQIEKRKQDLEEQINVIKANVSASKTIKHMTLKRNELLCKLASLEENQENLDGEINVIVVNISSSKRKRDIFEEGKKMKRQRDELREKAPHLLHEYGLAKETQTRIKAEWSKLGQKFKMIAAE